MAHSREQSKVGIPQEKEEGWSTYIALQRSRVKPEYIQKTFSKKLEIITCHFKYHLLVYRDGGSFPRLSGTGMTTLTLLFP